MKQGVGCDYNIKVKSTNNTEINKSVIIYIPGSGSANIDGVVKVIPDVFINKKEHDLLKEPIINSKTGTEKDSVFSFLIEQRHRDPKKGGILVQECGFNDMSAAKQKQYDPVYFNKLESQRKNQAEKDQAAYDAANQDNSKD